MQNKNRFSVPLVFCTLAAVLALTNLGFLVHTNWRKHGTLSKLILPTTQRSELAKGVNVKNYLDLTGL